MDTQRLRHKKKPPKIDEMSKDEIRSAILKKRECNAKAQTIVESLLDKCISEDYFIKCLPDINQSHFEDIIEERSILFLCGYPLCNVTLCKNEIPKQKYRISLKTNKVYDITIRKNFCSNGCYKSAMHVKKQMLTSPLWFREYEEIPKISLLPMNSMGSLGQEIDLKLIEKIDVKQENQRYTSINDFASASLNEISATDPQNKKTTINKTNVDCANENKENCNQNDIDSLVDTMKETSINVKKNDKNHDVEERQEESYTSTENIKKPISKPINLVGEIIEKKPENTEKLKMTSEKVEKTNKVCKKLPQKKQPSITAISIEVEKCLAEWFTLDTLLFLFGEEKVKEMVADKGECIKEYMNNYAKSTFYTSNTYDQYQALCHKLNMLELEERKSEMQTQQRETKPLPDYATLQEESKKLKLKVRAFYDGQLEIPEPETQELPSTAEEIENPTVLPLVDKNAQNALRRKIVCQHLNKALPDLLRSLGLSMLTISSDIKLLVNTFKLKANNIMFKPIQWTLIAIVFIKLLSIKDRRLEYLLAQPTGFQHMQLLLLSYKQDGGYLDRLISWLTDIDRMLDLNDTQLTIE